ncbi:Xaa-Pro peptidase family protein [Sporosarcina oncorhynchi]|uniref:Xaa-Pro peptidase family protein n=1 Tax=Sporosarcina oncorhynchi TaxID=3056444 RepID=A0ABZ0L670_9BACL|nr:Xaa-Pro peptidase family protein [Sporosarcina sp. T2O-4]WOV88072.1 Xaa-Pro peptidase family protein [Sporosarcina sp. T2O-4]
MFDVKHSQLQNLMNEKQLDGVFIHSYENRRYFTGFTGSNGVYYYDGHEDYLWTDQRYTLQATEQAAFCTVEVANGPMDQFYASKLPERLKGRVGFESTEMSVSQFEGFKKMIPHVEWVPLQSEFLTIRARKSKEELSVIKKSIQASDQAFKQLLKNIHIGMTELDVRNELEYLMLKGGHEGPAFGTIVAFGERAALPHAVPTTRKLKENEYVLIDFGINYEGYMSDMTRTIAVGEIDNESSKVFELTLKALESSIKAVRPGVTGSQLDAIARDIFEEAGLEKYSLRGLGHGVGLQIHESPRIVQNGTDIVEEGMVFTIEPGIYIPNQVGVRIEDIVYVTEEGCDVLTTTPRRIELAI